MIQVANGEGSNELDNEVCGQVQHATLDLYSVASVGIVFPNSCHISPNQACHAGLNNEYDGNYSCGSLAIVSLIHDNEGLGYSEAKYYLQWLFNDSFWADCFVDKDAAYTIKRGFIITRTDVPSNILMGALISSRRISEYVHIAQMFNKLHKAGMNGELAYLLAHHVSRGTMRDNKGDLLNLNVGHTAVDVTNMGKKALGRFIDRTPVHVNEDYHDSWIYFGVDKMWWSDQDPYCGCFNDESPLTRIVHKLFDYKEVKAGRKQKVERIGLNPFPLDVVVERGVRVCLDALVNLLVELEPTIIKEIRNV